MPLIEMSPMIISGEGFGAGSLIGKQSLAPVQELWDVWQIHGLILISLALQVFLFLTASMRRRSSSSILRTLLWLAYLSADSVAIFVLGHLAVHASRPHHQLISFWAPFVLVHLGGQDTITAFSKQDNELWRRNLLRLVTQVGLAGYVVARVSWPDRRLRNAMVLIFLSGCFKYTERILCLYLASPPVLRSKSLGNLSRMLNNLRRDAQKNYGLSLFLEIAQGDVNATFQYMLEGCWSGWWYRLSSQCPCVEPSFEDETNRIERIMNDIMSADTALNKEASILAADYISDQLNRIFLSNAGRCRAYEFVGACLVDCYHSLYTKKPLRKPLGHLLWLCVCGSSSCTAACLNTLLLPYTFFRWVSTPMALLLFRAAEKGGQLHTSSPADVTVSYILLVGALALDVCAATISLYGEMTHSHGWSEELAQYSMIKRHTAQDTSGMASIRQWIGRRLGGWGVGLLELTQTPVTQDHTPIKEFILDNLLRLGARKEWNIATSRGKLALQKWMETQELGSDSGWPGKEVLDHGLSANFPTSVLIWHIATDMCYYFGDNDDSTDSDQMKKHKQMSRELSNYIMYLVFKCGIMLTSQSQLVHDKAHGEINGILSDQQHRPGDKDAIRKLFEAKNEEPSGIHTDGSQQLLRSIEEALYSPVLPRAREVAQVLIGIENETERWGLIASVWSEMLYYIAPRCGGAFHYEHLSNGGQFITHVLLLMYHLGPFLPTPDS
ncbi:hypothetical protein SEVIR_2G058600v4 [Setaria viridis]|uniref:uncharacterized protein n=1 Tax=Setaria viridis TaxID=4556 RepID=UPI00149382CA|nr:uncharacterized protein LOC117843140 [Setaria viridis]